MINNNDSENSTQPERELRDDEDAAAHPLHSPESVNGWIQWTSTHAKLVNFTRHANVQQPGPVLITPALHHYRA